MRWVPIVLLGVLASCGGDDGAKERADKEAVELKRQIEALRTDNAQKEAQEAELKEQLHDEAAEKVELLKEMERVEAAGRRVEEVKKLE
jgi:hypothetical protein